MSSLAPLGIWLSCLLLFKSCLHKSFIPHCKIQFSTLLHCVPYSPRGLEGSREEIQPCRYRLERYFPVQFPAPLHDAAFPVCQVSLLVACGSFVFCFSKAASTHRLVSYCTAKRNLLRYCTAPPIPAYLIYLRPKEYPRC